MTNPAATHEVVKKIIAECEKKKGGRVIPPRHYVENKAFDPDNPEAATTFEPGDTTLCGKPWDRLFVKHNGEICQECLDELKRRGQA